MTGRRFLLPVTQDPKVAQLFAAPWPNFTPPLTSLLMSTTVSVEEPF